METDTNQEEYQETGKDSECKRCLQAVECVYQIKQQWRNQG